MGWQRVSIVHAVIASAGNKSRQDHNGFIPQTEDPSTICNPTYCPKDPGAIDDPHSGSSTLNYCSNTDHHCFKTSQPLNKKKIGLRLCLEVSIIAQSCSSNLRCTITTSSTRFTLILASITTFQHGDLLSLILVLQVCQPCLPTFNIPRAFVKGRILSFLGHLKLNLIHSNCRGDLSILGDLLLLVIHINQPLSSLSLHDPELLLKISYLEILKHAHLLKISNLALLVLNIAKISFNLSKFLQTRE
ncbi:hypothetical protein HanLR1_Chr09g0311911 [Helianthus annuus]|nr:hypothetical protein HanHA89_Chr09g0332451 [Helianthus annuus]KAJ0706863.1 hypothetical protein HanLR1_Chr09g0311911 [Helianthus annuus]